MVRLEFSKQIKKKFSCKRIGLDLSKPDFSHSEASLNLVACLLIWLVGWVVLFFVCVCSCICECICLFIYLVGGGWD